MAHNKDLLKIKKIIKKGIGDNYNAGFWFPRKLTEGEMKELDKLYKFNHRPFMEKFGQFCYLFYKLN